MLKGNVFFINNTEASSLLGNSTFLSELDSAVTRDNIANNTNFTLTEILNGTSTGVYAILMGFGMLYLEILLTTPLATCTS